MLRPILTQEQYDALNDILKAEYRVMDGGGFILDVERSSGFELTNTSTLMAQLSSANGERDNIRQQLEALQGQLGGADPATLLQAQQRLAELTANGGAPDAAALRSEIEAQLRSDYERQSNTLVESHQTELSARDERISALEGQLNETLFTDRARSAVLAVDKDAEPQFLLPEIQRRTRIVEREGRRELEVINANGETDFTTENGRAVPKTLKHLVEELRNDPTYGRAFTVGTGGGSGAGPAAGDALPGADEKNPWDRTSEHFSLTEQGRISRENPELAKRLKAAAPAPQRQPMIPRQPSGGAGTATSLGIV